MSAGNWLDALKPGDTVLVGDHWNRRETTVAKRDKVKIVLAAYGGGTGEVYSAKTGRHPGASTWNRSSIAEATPDALADVREKVARAKAVERIERMLSKKLCVPVATLEAAAELLDPSPPKSAVEGLSPSGNEETGG